MIVAHTSYVIFTVTSQTVVAFTMKYLTFFLNIICLNFCVSLNTNSKLQIIVDIAKSFNKPTSVVAKMCWESNKRSKYGR